jgi:hypothetical protein
MIFIGIGLLGLFFGGIIFFIGLLTYLSFTFDTIWLDIDYLLLDPADAMTYIISGFLIILGSSSLIVFQYFYYIKYQERKNKEKFLEEYNKIYNQEHRQKM